MSPRRLAERARRTSWTAGELAHRPANSPHRAGSSTSTSARAAAASSSAADRWARTIRRWPRRASPCFSTAPARQARRLGGGEAAELRADVFEQAGDVFEARGVRLEGVLAVEPRRGQGPGVDLGEVGREVGPRGDLVGVPARDVHGRDDAALGGERLEGGGEGPAHPDYPRRERDEDAGDGAAGALGVAPELLDLLVGDSESSAVAHESTVSRTMSASGPGGTRRARAGGKKYCNSPDACWYDPVQDWVVQGTGDKGQDKSLDASRLRLASPSERASEQNAPDDWVGPFWYYGS